MGITLVGVVLGGFALVRADSTTTDAAPTARVISIAATTTTTIAPTTTTIAPTTSTTLAPTTLAPTTLAPATIAPATIAPATTVKPKPRTATVAPKPAPAPAPAPAPVALPTSNVAADCIARTNAERAKAGLQPVTYDSRIQKAAQGHSNYQASISTMTHDGSGGPGARISAAGYGWHAYGENVAAGQGSCALVMSAWMASPGHRANILNGTFVNIGVAMTKSATGVPYWTMDLAAP